MWKGETLLDVFAPILLMISLSAVVILLSLRMRAGG
jgi:hypothetical protein